MLLKNLTKALVNIDKIPVNFIKKLLRCCEKLKAEFMKRCKIKGSMSKDAFVECNVCGYKIRFKPMIPEQEKKIRERSFTCWNLLSERTPLNVISWQDAL